MLRYGMGSRGLAWTKVRVWASVDGIEDGWYMLKSCWLFDIAQARWEIDSAYAKCQTINPEDDLWVCLFVCLFVGVVDEEDQHLFHAANGCVWGDRIGHTWVKTCPSSYEEASCLRFVLKGCHEGRES